MALPSPGQLSSCLRAGQQAVEEAEELQGQAPTAQEITVLGTSLVPFHIDTSQGYQGG